MAPKINLKALIVDDSATIRKIIRNNLARFNIVACDEAADGKAAWQLVNSNDYNIIFTDYNMPEMNGLEFVTKVSQSGDKFSNIRIIAVSSVFSDDLIEKFKDVGVSSFIAKPFSLEMFKEAIGPILLSALGEGDDAKALSMDDLSKMFQGNPPQTSFDGQYLVLDFGSEKLTIDAKAIAKAATVFANVD